MKSVALHNLGCKVNSYELDVIGQKLKEKGFSIVPFDEKADIYIVNTCSVTNIADRKAGRCCIRQKSETLVRWWWRWDVMCRRGRNRR